MFSIKKAWEIFDNKQKRYSIYIFVFMFLAMILESLSVGIMVPVLSVLLKGNIELNFFSHYFSYKNLDDNNLIVTVLIITATVFFIKNIYLIFNNWFQLKFLEKIYVELSDKLFKSYLKRDYIFFLQTNTARLIRNVSEEIDSFVNYTNHFMQLLSEVIIFLGIAAVLFYVDFFGTLIILLLVGIFALTIYIFTRRKISILGEERITIKGELSKHLIQGMTAAKDIKILGREDNLIYQFYKNLFKSGKIRLFIKFTNSVPRFLFEILIVFAFSIIVLFMLSINRDMIDIVKYLGVFAAASFRMLPGISRILTAFQVLKFRTPSVNLLFEEFYPKDNFLKEEYSPIKNKKELINFEKEINIKDLSFSYPIRKEFSLSNISINIKKGDFIGVIGETGSGKSTLINLFTGLLKPSLGRIEVDGENIYSNLYSWHKKIGYVPQSIYLVDDTIRKNIAFGLRENDIDDNLVKKAAENASLNAFLKNLPNGLDTIVGEKGIRISGGQQQRIGIARALYRDPEILILDEATSSLDIVTEKKIMESVHYLKRNKTLIVITHRLSTVEKCDKVYFINKGKIIKEGLPQEVLEGI